MPVFFRVLSIVLIFVAGPAKAEWPAQSASLGAKEHPKVLQQYGGAVQNSGLSAYVSDIGARVIAVSDRPNEIWRFTVLDSPQVNAFALPGGYVYVTRGLLALANSESELAAVLAHEVIHVTEQHVEARQEAQKDALVNGALSALVTGIIGGGENRVGNAVRSGVESALGDIGSYSKEQEFAADAGGIALLRRAGYRPAAQADFLASMSANAALKAEIAGRDFDESTTPFFANHPAPAERQLRALALAGDEDGNRGIEEYLAAIDGIIFGQSARGGFVDGQVFTHSELGFTFEAAEGLRIQNAARQINILGPDRSTLILSGAPDSGNLSNDLAAWAAQIPRTERISRRIDNQRRLTINGLEAITGTLRLRKRGKRSTLQMTLIRFEGNLIRFAATVQRGDTVSEALHWQTVQSFRPLAARASAQNRETYIRIHRVARGENASGLAREMAIAGYNEAWFRVLNGQSDHSEILVGQLVKLVSR